MESPNLTSEMPKEAVNGAVAEREKKRSSRKSKEDKSSRKKDEKSLELVLKSLSNTVDPVEKFQLLSRKYGELYEESKKDTATVKVSEKQLMMLQRERDSLHQDQAKSMLARNRLEELCRELQKQNRAMKEESIQRVREEEEKRKEVSSKFHTTLSEISTLMQENTESNAKLREENLEMQKQLKSLWDQYGLREQQAEKMTKQIKLEGQLAEAKIAKAKLEFEAQRETIEREKAELGAQLALCQSRCIGHEKTEEALRAQINVYFEKYDEFQNVLTKSNSVYSGFKTEMEKMSKKITRLEKETSTWKQKWETTHKSLLALAAEKQGKDEEVALQARQLAKMQKLCRTLLMEKTALEKAIGKKTDEGDSESTLIEDTIAAHMAVSDVIVGKPTPKAEAHKSKKKSETKKQEEKSSVKVPQDQKQIEVKKPDLAEKLEDSSVTANSNVVDSKKSKAEEETAKIALEDSFEPTENVSINDDKQKSEVKELTGKVLKTQNPEKVVNSSIFVSAKPEVVEPIDESDVQNKGTVSKAAKETLVATASDPKEESIHNESLDKNLDHKFDSNLTGHNETNESHNIDASKSQEENKNNPVQVSENPNHENSESLKVEEEKVSESTGEQEEAQSSEKVPSVDENPKSVSARIPSKLPCLQAKGKNAQVSDDSRNSCLDQTEAIPKDSGRGDAGVKPELPSSAAKKASPSPTSVAGGDAKKPKDPRRRTKKK